jgi:hypothetical protein
MYIKPGSQKSKYYLEKEELLTVYHYCRQYPHWKRQLAELDPPNIRSVVIDGLPHGSGSGDTTARTAIRRVDLERKIRTVEDTVREVTPEYWRGMLAGVTENRPYYNIRQHYHIPVGENEYYRKRREIYWRISKKM